MLGYFFFVFVEFIVGCVSLDNNVDDCVEI